ncbi:MAG: T9SS type A sorting domain-containing protein [Planctomycetes bacterium]|nr:T9SS type A sorting domain-containing protein [Planctomycetota bacterium]
MKRTFLLLIACGMASIVSAQVNLLPTIGIGAMPLDSDPICTIPMVGGASDNVFVGDTIPHFNLYDIAGVGMDIETTLEQGKAVLIMCGSYTCPAFRNKVDELAAIQALYPTQIQTMMIYVVEAHPQSPDLCPYSGLVNEANNASIGALYPQPTTYGERKVIVQAFIDSMSIAISGIPIYIDGVCNEWWHAFGEAPNDGFLIDPSGVVAIEHVWFDKIPDDMFADVAAYVAANPSLGTPSYHMDQMNVYPNPIASGAELQIGIPEGVTGFTFEITDLTGRTSTDINNQQTIRLEENTFPAGLYVWKMTTSKGEVSSGKLIIN